MGTALTLEAGISELGPWALVTVGGAGDILSPPWGDVVGGGQVSQPQTEAGKLRVSWRTCLS